MRGCVSAIVFINFIGYDPLLDPNTENFQRNMYRRFVARSELFFIKEVLHGFCEFDTIIQTLGTLFDFRKAKNSGLLVRV